MEATGNPRIPDWLARNLVLLVFLVLYRYRQTNEQMCICTYTYRYTTCCKPSFSYIVPTWRPQLGRSTTSGGGCTRNVGGNTSVGAGNTSRTECAWRCGATKYAWHFVAGARLPTVSPWSGTYPKPLNP